MTTLHFNALVPPFDLGEGSGTEAAEKSNVLTYGADSTGVEDSTEAFKKAGEESNEIYAPPGTYLIAGELELAGKRLRGAGEEATKLTKASAAAAMLKITKGHGEILDLTIENTVKPTSGSTILLTAPEEVGLRNIKIFQSWNAIEVTGSGGGVAGGSWFMNEINVRGWENTAVLVHDGPVLLQCVNSVFANVNKKEEAQYVGVGIQIQATTAIVEGLSFTDCEVLFSESPLKILGEGFNCGGCMFSNCFFDSYKGPSGKAGILLKEATQVLFTSCWFAPSGAPLSGSAIWVEKGGDVNFVSCMSPGAPEHNIVLTETEGISMVGCQLYNPSELEAEKYDCIHLEKKCIHVNLVSNILAASARGTTTEPRYGIFVGAQENTDYTIIGNRYAAAVGKGILADEATTKFKVVYGNLEKGKAPKGAAGKLAEAGAAAVKVTANTAINGTVFNLTGSKAKGFINGAIVNFKKVTAGVTIPKANTLYNVIGEGTNGFELATQFKTAAFKLTTNTAELGTVFNLNGAKSKGFLNGSPVTFKQLTPGVTNPVSPTTTYFVVGEAANTFELATTIAGAAIKVEGHELVAATTEVQLEGVPLKVETHTLEEDTEITLEGANADKALHTRVNLIGEVEAEKAVEVKVTVEGNEVGKVKITKSGAAEPQFVPLGAYDLLPGGKWQVKEVAGLAKVFASTATLNA